MASTLRTEGGPGPRPSDAQSKGVAGTPPPAMGRPGLSFDGVVPGKVLKPASAEAVRAALEAASAEALTAAPVGGRTRLGLGNAPRSIDLALDMTRMNALIRHTPEDLTASAEAGITISQLQAALAERGQFLAVDPPLPERATLGGTLAVGFSGPLKWLYGNVRDCVIGLSAAQADGKLTRSGGQVVKNVSGYDLVRMHVGALGTLGIIAEVSVKLTPLPRKQSTLLAGMDSAAKAWDAALAVFRSNLTPLALTAYDDEARRRMGAPDAGSPAYVAIRLGGRPLTVERQQRECRAVLSRFGGARQAATVDDSLASALWRALADFGYTAQTEPYLLARAALKPVEAARAAARLSAAPCRGLRAAVLGQPAHGTLNVAWYEEDRAASVQAASESILAARKTVEEMGGRLIIERCSPDLKRRVDVWGDVGQALGTMRRLKSQFDPDGLLNRGRYVGGI